MRQIPYGVRILDRGTGHRGAEGLLDAQRKLDACETVEPKIAFNRCVGTERCEARHLRMQLRCELSNKPQHRADDARLLGDRQPIRNSVHMRF